MNLVQKIALAAVGITSSALAVPVDFFYNSQNYGVMNLTVANSSTVQVSFAANVVAGVSTFDVTGFAFALVDGVNASALSISNPTAGAFTTDNDVLNWVRMTKLSPIPNAANDGTSKTVWDLGATEPNQNNQNENFTPPGVTPGTSDIFFLSGFSGLTNDASILANISMEGIRIQSLPNGGSLFLNGTIRPPELPQTAAVPEPGTMALMGLGLAGLGFAARRRRK